MKLFRKTGLFPYKDSAENSKRWWENQGYKVITRKAKGGYVNYIYNR
jgi:hypothetical protein